MARWLVAAALVSAAASLRVVPVAIGRRGFQAGAAAAAARVLAPGAARAVEAPWQSFVDSEFSLQYPAEFFRGIRRTIGGDVVRRGGIIFTTGRLSRAEMVTVEQIEVSAILAQAAATSFFPGGKLDTWAQLGSLDAIGELLCERRDSEAQAAAKGMPRVRSSQTLATPVISNNGRTVTADIITRIGTQKARVGDAAIVYDTPALVRVQRASLTLLPGGDRIIGIWASCLEDYWNEGEGGVLRGIVDTFKPNTEKGEAVEVATYGLFSQGFR
ncbi:hypothetical protein M885DRAFT_626646 [Pelagophyceae sp. CCMP2097]|nr:hypothetical protein M885DRAFT_626646 [Pelagophyceae sp. CCMP2097]|mmetsp:Transcript_14444/g.50252  ORF Transcript_14444/g.50252 Transcript_14444/m.50252 type:complete len:272 (-) Transcript_14444:56-871(-)